MSADDDSALADDRDDDDIDVLMLHAALSAAPVHTLPAGYFWRFYRGPDDVEDWLELHRRIAPDEPWNRRTFDESLGLDQVRLAERVRFLHAPDGARVGSITVWNDAKFGSTDIGRIRWVVLDPSVQGRGLSKPLLSAAIQHLRALGYETAYLSTSTNFVPAVNLYLQFGFEPVPRTQAEYDTWHNAQTQGRFKRRYSLPDRAALPRRA